MKNAAIVVTAFNRPKSLKRILSSIAKAEYKTNSVEIVISIDFLKDCKKNKEVIAIANNFKWIHGNKKILIQKKNLGLKEHILKCGDMLLDKYESIIVLEDDCFVSPYFYEYAMKSIRLFLDYDDICGISLYSPSIHEYTGCDFTPLYDGFDNYFVQSASSWGQAWTRNQWILFKKWYKNNSAYGVTSKDNVPEMVYKWPESSWKKYFIKYQQETKRFFSFPRYSLSTNFADAGTHFRIDTNLHQTPLLTKDKTWKLSLLNQSSAKYDCYFEIMDVSIDSFNNIEFDTYGVKNLNLIDSEYLVSNKKCKHPMKQYSDRLKPLPLNILYDVSGCKLSFGKTIDFINKNDNQAYEKYENLSIKFLCRLLVYKCKNYIKRIVRKN